MTSIKFIGKNYIYWAWYVVIFFKRKGVIWSSPVLHTIIPYTCSDATSSDVLTTFPIFATSTSLWDQELHILGPK